MAVFLGEPFVGLLGLLGAPAFGLAVAALPGLALPFNGALDSLTVVFVVVLVVVFDTGSCTDLVTVVCLAVVRVPVVVFPAGFVSGALPSVLSVVLAAVGLPLVGLALDPLATVEVADGGLVSFLAADPGLVVVVVVVPGLGAAEVGLEDVVPGLVGPVLVDGLEVAVAVPGLPAVPGLVLVVPGFGPVEPGFLVPSAGLVLAVTLEPFVGLEVAVLVGFVVVVLVVVVGEGLLVVLGGLVGLVVF